MAKWLKENFSIASNVNVIPNCVDVLDDQTHGKSDLLIKTIIPEDFLDKRIILYSGRLLAMKGVDDLVDAIPEISNAIGKNELLFIFAGPGDSSKYRQKLDKLNVKSAYLFTGSLPRESLIKLIRRSKNLQLYLVTMRIAPMRFWNLWLVEHRWLLQMSVEFPK